MTELELLFQELLKHQKSGMHDFITWEFELSLQGLPKHRNNMVHQLQIFEQKRLIAAAVSEGQDTWRKVESSRQTRTRLRIDPNKTVFNNNRDCYYKMQWNILMHGMWSIWHYWLTRQIHFWLILLWNPNTVYNTYGNTIHAFKQHRLERRIL